MDTLSAQALPLVLPSRTDEALAIPKTRKCPQLAYKSFLVVAYSRLGVGKVSGGDYQND